MDSNKVNDIIDLKRINNIQRIMPINPDNKQRNPEFQIKLSVIPSLPSSKSLIKLEEENIKNKNKKHLDLNRLHINFFKNNTYNAENKLLNKSNTSRNYPVSNNLELEDLDSISKEGKLPSDRANFNNTNSNYFTDPNLISKYSRTVVDIQLNRFNEYTNEKPENSDLDKKDFEHSQELNDKDKDKNKEKFNDMTLHSPRAILNNSDILNNNNHFSQNRFEKNKCKPNSININKQKNSENSTNGNTYLSKRLSILSARLVKRNSEKVGNEESLNTHSKGIHMSYLKVSPNNSNKPRKLSKSKNYDLKNRGSILMTSRRESIASKNLMLHPVNNNNYNLDPSTYYNSESTNRRKSKNFQNGISSSGGNGNSTSLYNPKFSSDGDNTNLNNAEDLQLGQNEEATELVSLDAKKKYNDKKRNTQIQELLSESKTRIFITESITKKVILLILCLILILPLLSEDLFPSNESEGYNILANYLSNYATILPENMDFLISHFIEKENDINYPIINITSTDGFLYYRNETIDRSYFRPTDFETVISQDEKIIILYSVIYENQLNSILSIFKTFFICICLLVAIVYFEKDAKSLVLDPLEIMIEIVELVSKDPTNAKNLGSLETGAKSTLLKIKFFDEKKFKKYQMQKEKSEVKVIQLAIKKIAALLAIGMGEAGNEIIKENLSSYNDLDPMIKGKKKRAIFGFCDIRDFSTVTESLQENTILFINQIADIVHSSVDLYFGSINKNIGDAFLSVWKIPINPDNIKTLQENDLSLKVNPKRGVSHNNFLPKDLENLEEKKPKEPNENKYDLKNFTLKNKCIDSSDHINMNPNKSISIKINSKINEIKKESEEDVNVNVNAPTIKNVLNNKHDLTYNLESGDNLLVDNLLIKKNQQDKNYNKFASGSPVNKGIRNNNRNNNYDSYDNYFNKKHSHLNLNCQNNLTDLRDLSQNNNANEEYKNALIDASKYESSLQLQRIIHQKGNSTSCEGCCLNLCNQKNQSYNNTILDTEKNLNSKYLIPFMQILKNIFDIFCCFNY